MIQIAAWKLYLPFAVLPGGEADLVISRLHGFSSGYVMVGSVG
jgi:hypothetical protein